MRTPPLLCLVASLALPAAAQDAAPRTLPVGKYMAPAGEREPRTIGPTGTLGADVYRKRRKALVDKLKGGATVIYNEGRFEHDREGMNFYYLTGVDEPGAALILDPAGVDPEVLFLQALDFERDRWDGERAVLPSQVLEATTGIAAIRRTYQLPAMALQACKRGGLNFVETLVAPPAPRPKTLALYKDLEERSFSCRSTTTPGCCRGCGR